MISVARVRARLGLTAAEPQDTILALLIAEVTAVVGHELGRYLGQPATTEELHKGPGCMILLREEPLASPVPTVHTRGRATEAWTLVPTTDYVIEGRALRNDTGWPCCPGRVKVTYRRGYETDAGPADLQHLIMLAVSAKWTSLALDDDLLKSETIGDYSYTRFDLAALQAAPGEAWNDVSRRWRRAFV